MLYVTTRNNRDAFTANRALREERCPDGGMYLPFRAPRFTQEEIAALADKSFSRCVAEVLNLLFNTKLTSWDVEFCIGRYPVRLETLRHRIIIAESWHNPDLSYDLMVYNLTALLCKDYQIPADWVKIAVRVAVLVGIYGELMRSGVETTDISVLSGDFSAPISVWYARQWGLPVGNIICCCNENNALWELICHGQIRTDAISVPTIIPDADVALPADLERLIYECGGLQETDRYLTVCRRGGVYAPEDAVLQKLRKGVLVSVVSSRRIESIIPSAWQTHSYLMAPCTALAYAGLLDYRAKTGETRHSIILAEKSPACDAETMAGILGIPVDAFKNRI